MSLISLSSNDENSIVSQEPFNFKNNFAQPITIKPNSQIALVNFYHFRNDSLYNVTLDNNRIIFNFGSPDSNGRWEAHLTPNTYEGDELATEIARALNEANIAFQNYNFACAFTKGNPMANPAVNDTFEITFTSVTTPTPTTGTYEIFEKFDSLMTIVNGAGGGTRTDIVRTNQTNDTSIFSVVGEKHGIHNHEGQVIFEGINTINNNNELFTINAGTSYDHGFGENAQIFGLYAEDLCGLTNTDPNKNFKREIGTIYVLLRNKKIQIKTLNRGRGRTATSPFGSMILKRDIDISIGTDLHTGLSNLLFTNNQRWKDITYRFVFYKDGTSNVAIQLQVSADGGNTYVIPSEGASDAGNTFGTNAIDNCANIYSTKAINGVNRNGIIYMSKIGGNLDINGAANNTIAKSNQLAKARGKYRCIMSINNRAEPDSLTTGDMGESKYDFSNRTFDIDYGAGGSKFNLVVSTHTGGNAFDFNLATNTQSGTPIANQLQAVDLNNCALKTNNTKNALGLVYDIHSDNTNAGSPVVGELHFDRRATNNSERGNISLRNFTGALNNRIEIFNITIPTSIIQMRSKKPNLYLSSGVFNQNVRTRLLGAGKIAEPQYHIADHTLFEDLDNLPDTLGATLSSQLVLLVDRISRQDIDTIPNLNATPLGSNTNPITINTRSGSIGRLIGYSNNILFMNAPADNQPINPNNPFLSDSETLIITKDQTLHVSISELSGVKSIEGESSQQYKTIKVIPKSDFIQGSNGSLSFTANYLDYIDINNANELQLSEMTLQVRTPSGKLVRSLEPITRATFKIQQNPSFVESDKMNKIMDRLERSLSQNQKQLPNVISNPNKLYT